MVATRFAPYFYFLVIATSVYILLSFFMSTSEEIYVFKLIISKESVAKLTTSSGMDEKIDWHDHDFMAYEAKREGPGEQGEPVLLRTVNDLQEDSKSYVEEGFSKFISDLIAPNR